MRLPTLVLFLVMAAGFGPSTLAEEFAWQQTDRYVPPDFEGFFSR